MKPHESRDIPFEDIKAIRKRINDLIGCLHLQFFMSTTLTMRGCACLVIPNCIPSRIDIFIEYIDLDIYFVVLDPEYPH